MTKKAKATTVVVVILGIIIVASAGIFSGVYNVGATSPHPAIVAGLLDVVMTRSVAFHSRNDVAPDLESSAVLALGFDHYNQMCIGCHGAPGVDKGDIGNGLYPSPPLLKEAAADWTAPQLHWLVANGVQDTGMPAFKPTHTDAELWAMTAFTLKLPKMSPEDFKRMSSSTL